MSAEPPDFIDNGRYDVMRGQMPMAPQCVDVALSSISRQSFLQPCLPVLNDRELLTRVLHYRFASTGL